MPALTPPDQTPFRRLLESVGSAEPVCSQCSTCLLPRGHFGGTHFSHQPGTGALSDACTFSPRNAKIGLRIPWREPISQLSPSHVILWFMTLNISVTLCSLRISFWALIVWQTPLLIKMYSARAATRAKVLSSGFAKPTRQEKRKH